MSLSFSNIFYWTQSFDYHHNIQWYVHCWWVVDIFQIWSFETMIKWPCQNLMWYPLPTLTLIILPNYFTTPSIYLSIYLSIYVAHHAKAWCDISINNLIILSNSFITLLYLYLLGGWGCKCVPDSEYPKPPVWTKAVGLGRDLDPSMFWFEFPYAWWLHSHIKFI